MTGTNFSGATLEQSQLDNCLIEKTNFQGASLIAANLNGTKFTDAKIEGAKLSGINRRGESRIPIRAYLSDSKNAEKVKKGIEKFLESLKWEIDEEDKDEYSSWFKKWIAKHVSPTSEKVIREELEKAKRGIELQLIHKTQAKVDKDSAEGIAALIGSLKDEKEAILQYGSVLMIKTTDTDGKSGVFVRSLTQKELILIESNPSILKEPKTLLTKLETASQLAIER